MDLAKLFGLPAHPLLVHVLAGSLRPLAIVLFLLVLALVLLDGHRPPARPSWVVPVVPVAAVLSGVATSYRLAEVGHNGARASWGDTEMSSNHGRPRGG